MHLTAAYNGHEGNNLTTGIDRLVIHSSLNFFSRLLYAYRCAQNTELFTGIIWQQ